MKISLQLNLIPLSTTQDKLRWAVDEGVEAIELGGWGGGHDDMRKLGDQVRAVLPVSSICGNYTPDGTQSFDFLDPDPARRRASIEGSKAILAYCGQVGAAGQIVPPIFGGPVVPDLSPLMDPLAIEEHLMVAALKEVGPWAAEHDTLFLVEPLNRYEPHYLRRQSDGVRVIEKAQVPGVGLLSDFFHMHIEETDTPAALREARSHVSQVHLADNTRMEPGTGDIDFVAGFGALKQIGFEGFMSYECQISGDTPDEKRKNLSRSVQFVRTCIERAG